MPKPKSSRYPVYINRSPMETNRLTEHLEVKQPIVHIIVKIGILLMVSSTIMLFLTGFYQF